ncbi:PTS system, mannose-specific IIB component [Lachnospiraceae bacterium C10]|jgi:PTS system mannose-specific IIB component|nr:PTS sugar transporter subunit IIB [Lachnospiraceae bacterium]SCW59920.1 PTS system, mannose-specific IIB component [Lachnospiraceae bacterium C10]SDW69381.1 PTS system, mannose-specific IIB component [Lachnospiraceae bacterium KHCPX20]
MVGIVIASHGDFASGIFQSGQMILGAQENVKACTLMPSDGPDAIRKQMEDAIASFDDPTQVLFLCDLWGGTPFNQASALIAGHEDTWAIVTGLNLPMLIEAYGARFTSESAQEIASQILGASRDGVKVKPESLDVAPKATATAAAPAAQGAIPEGTVLGDGKIKYVHVRLDTRLLHGQVATAWTKAVNPDRIICVSDGVAHDELRKTMITEAAPPGVKANVVPIKKMCEVQKDPRFGATKAMLLFENPQDLLAAVEGGLEIEKVNIGSIAHSIGKVVLTKAVAMGKEDVEAFDKLLARGIKFDVRKVPADSPENFDNMMKKAKAELGM